MNEEAERLWAFGTGEDYDALRQHAEYCRDAIDALREQVAAKDAEIGNLRATVRREIDPPWVALAKADEKVERLEADNAALRSGHETFLWKRAVENADREKKETFDAFMLLSDKHTLMTERAERAEADNAALRQTLTDMKPYWDGATRGSFSRELVALNERIDAAIAKEKP